MSEEQEEYAPEQEAQEEQTEETAEETGEEVEESGADSEEADEVEQEEVPPKHVPVKALIEERKKRQELEKRLEVIEQGQQRQQTQAPTHSGTVEEYFDADPEGVLTYIDQEIAAREAAFATTFDPQEEADIKRLERTKMNLLQRQILMQRREQETKQRIAPIDAEIKKAIPDERRAEVRAFAIENGLSEKDVDTMLNPAIVGDFAPRAAKLLASLHAKVTQPPTRRVSMAPDPISTVGGGRKQAEPDPSKMSDDEWLRHEQARLKKLGRLY